MKQLNVTELDFDQIKNNLKQYFKERPDGAYDDWDFEGSGINQMLDVLAYNTHYNAILAHNSLNESFIDTAQIRSNVVSRAKLLGYVPRSRTAAMATIALTFPASINDSRGSYTVESGLKFTTDIDDVTYSFITTEDYTAQLDQVNEVYLFPKVEIYEGRIKHNKYVVVFCIKSLRSMMIQSTFLNLKLISMRMPEQVRSKHIHVLARSEKLLEILRYILLTRIIIATTRFLLEITFLEKSQKL